jgi:SAM-dependent methyltransferase
MDAYREDLAYIHNVGHSGLAEAAGQRLVAELRLRGLDKGVVVDLGCGGGVFARILSRAGYKVIGFDMSEAMVAIARERVPDAEFYLGSFVSVELPSCIAVAAIGEVLNFAFDQRNNSRARENLYFRVNDALMPGGVFLFDVATRSRATSGVRRTFAEGPDWAALVESDFDEATAVLTRRITTFRHMGATYRRGTETHKLQLVDPDEVLQALDSAGFETEGLLSYGPDLLPVGLLGFLSQKKDRPNGYDGLQP